MSFDLRAILRFDGSQFYSGMNKANSLMDKNKRMMDKLSSATSNANRHHLDLGSSAGKLSSGLGSLKNSILGVAAAYGTVSSAKAIFENTVGKAMQDEVNAISIGAMFDSKEASKSYLKMMEDMALKSPVLSFTDMAAGSKGVLALTRDSKTLEKTWKNVEKLQAFAPDKSTEDAIRGIKELASGDYVSLKEVFNLDKKDLNALKGLSFEDQVDGLDKMLDKMKITDKFIDEIGQTSFAKFNQVKESFDRLFSAMGGPSLDVVSGFFDGILKRLGEDDAARFASIGANWIKNILTGLTNSVIGIYDWFAAISSSDDWKKATTLLSKVNVVIDDLGDRFNSWYKNGGKSDLEIMANTLTTDLITFIQNNGPAITTKALEIGSSIGDAFKSGIAESLKKNNPFLYYLGQWFNDPLVSTFGGIDKPRSQGGKYIAPDWYKSLEEKGRSHAGGLDRVPYDGYRAVLHKDEKILPRGAAAEYRNGKTGGNSFQFNVTLNGTGSSKEDAKQLFELFVKEVEHADRNGA